MKAILLTALCFIFLAQIAYAQDDAKLLVQSPDGKKVMLVWFLKTWSSEVTGFDIKRKEGLQDWVKLNREPILPGISMKKKLLIVNSDKSEASKLEARLYKMLASRKLKETQNSAYLEKLATDEKTLHDLNEQMMHDYEIALMNGFAFIDRTATSKTNYEYGLFIAGTNKMLANAAWNYGEIPDLNTIHEITSKATIKARGVLLMWDADQDKMKNSYVAGFNIYRQGIRLNNNPVRLTDNKDSSEFIWYDKSANSTEQQQYSISVETIFGIEGIIKPYTYDPAQHPSEYKKPVVSEISAASYYLKEGVNMKWEFPKEDEKFLKGFYVEKDNMPSGYVRASPLLDPSARAYADKTSSPVNSYVRVRVIAVYNDRTSIAGMPKLYSYFPVNDPPPPQSVVARLETKQADVKKYIVHLSWDAAMSGDNMTDYYKIFASQPESDLFSLVSDDHPVRANSFNYTIPPDEGGEFRFCITAAGKSNSESMPSDTVVVNVPLPVPVITGAEPDSNKVSLQWQYPDAHWLKGFRLYQNNSMIANESELKQNVRSYSVSGLPPGSAYTFSLQAVSETGTLSEASKPVSASRP